MSQFLAKAGDRFAALLIEPDGNLDWRYDITLDKELSAGGAAQIWSTIPSGGVTPLVAKVWGSSILSRTQASIDEASRLIPLVRHRGELYKSLPFVAWPRRILLTNHNLDNFQADVRGFTMLRLENTRQLEDIYTAAQPGQNMLQLHQTAFLAETLADHVGRLHNHIWQFRFGDLTPKNIHVANDFSSVHFVDSDSFQYTYVDPVASPQPTLFPVHGLTDAYTSPEGIRAMKSRASGASLAPLSADHDRTVLAILLYQIFMAQFDLGNTHPFFSADSLSEEQNIEAGRFPLDLADPPVNEYLVQQYQRIPSEIRQAFTQTFVHKQPIPPHDWVRLTRNHWRSLRPT